MTDKQIKIKYNGSFPNLCSGHLEVWVDDNYYDFGEALQSGGNVTFDENWCENVRRGKWYIEQYDYPEDFPMELADDLLSVINREIPWGCCGGCV